MMSNWMTGQEKRSVLSGTSIDQRPVHQPDCMPVVHMTAVARFLQQGSTVTLVLFFALMPVSVAYSEIAGGIALVLGLAVFILTPDRWREVRSRVAPLRPMLLPAAFWIIAAVLSASFARDSAGSFGKLSKFLVPFLFFAIPALVRTGRMVRHAVIALFVGGTATSVFGILKFIDEPGRRLGGFVGFYMTTAGLLLMIALLAFTIALTKGDRRLRLGATIVLPVVITALVLTDTRGAWIGLLAGLLLLAAFLLKRLVLVPVLLAGLLILFPGPVRETALSAIDPGHPRNAERLFMWEAGIRIFRDHPMTGTGLAGMRDVYLEYRDSRSTEKAAHLHSVPIQLLAAMGLIGFVAWVFLFGRLLRWLVRAFRRSRSSGGLGAQLPLAGMAISLGFIVNGLFEWNLGDVEVITLFWSLMGLAAAACADDPV